MLTEIQKNIILKDAFFAFKNQYGITFNPVDFDLRVDKPAQGGLCSIYIYSKRQDDNFKIKLYITNFSSFTSVGQFVLTQEQNYSTGSNDEVQLANCVLSKLDFKTFEIYLYSNDFLNEVVNEVDKIKLEDNSGFFLLENNSGNIAAEY
jgi:hypothetical protein